MIAEWLDEVASAMMSGMSPRLGYAILFVSDLGRSIAFYRDSIGLRLRFRTDAYAEFSADGTKFALFARSELPALLGIDAPSGRPPWPQGEVAFFVEDVDAECQRLRAAGVPVIAPPTDRPWGERTVHVADPDGNVVELTRAKRSNRSETSAADGKPDYSIRRIDEMEAVVAGSFKRARAALGVESFGMQVIDLPANSSHHHRHDHRDDGQEEVYVVLRGGGEIEVDDERHQIDPDTMVRVGPLTSRKLWPGPHGMRVLILGGVRRRSYRPPEVTELGAPDPGREISAAMTGGPRSKPAGG
jgi:lactoylglutathione lyase